MPAAMPLNAALVRHAAAMADASGSHLGRSFVSICRDWAKKLKAAKAIGQDGRAFLDMFVEHATWLEAQNKAANRRQAQKQPSRKPARARAARGR
jgi:hypothetical protein